VNAATGGGIRRHDGWQENVEVGANYLYRLTRWKGLAGGMAHRLNTFIQHNFQIDPENTFPNDELIRKRVLCYQTASTEGDLTVMTRAKAVLVTAVLAVTPLVAAHALRDGEKAEIPEEVTCAVMTGNKVSVKDATAKGMFADYEYSRYYFCCAGCPAAFNKEPEKFAKSASVPLSLIPLPETIPCAVMSDHKANIKEATEKKLFADHNGRRYYFCCAGCLPAFNKEPEKFAKSASVAIGQLPLPKETTCAVMTDNKVNVADALKKKMYADYKGRRYLFCCAGCPAAFKSDPAKFAANASIPSPRREKETAKAK